MEQTNSLVSKNLKYEYFLLIFASSNLCCIIVTIGETNLNDPLKDNASAVAENPDHQGEQIFKAGIETAVHQEG